ncbi:Gfo/Idh/MocA family protein [Breznakiella homolactica]|uniref:Gfo/Idh/MocA family oxidoreductase n=1 Tax=Breznakiella homolactica TaxID=2798577 RepID=A0A7T7XRM7_9SPIR|nr:Gfo/Idh/MocA family oxidoreductase [Breznakiella homolactica]QQO11249.1 Gfo/Idh/MocA family oxidoreductase [Breznakiella homolactica]
MAEGIRKVKTAVVGCGVISDIYLENMASVFSVLETAGCCDLNRDAAERTSQKYGIPVLTMEEILNNSEIELAVNLTTPGAHYPVIKELLSGGKHVYTEKPLTVSLNQAEELLALAGENKLLLGAAPDTFLGAAAQTARCIADSGIIGEITSCSAALNRDGGWMAEKYPYTAKPGGGIATDVGIYYITVLLSILGPVTEVSGFSETFRPERTHYHLARPDFGGKFTIESENLVAGSFRFAGGALGTIHLNANSIQNEQPQLILYGSEGILYLPDPNRFGGEVRVLLKGQNEPFVFPHTHGFSGNSRGLGAAELAWSLRRGRQPRASKEMAYHGLELLLGLDQSSRTKTWYTMKSTFERPAPLPRGYLGPEYSNSNPEASLAV